MKRRASSAGIALLERLQGFRGRRLARSEGGQLMWDHPLSSVSRVIVDRIVLGYCEHSLIRCKSPVWHKSIESLDSHNHFGRATNYCINETEFHRLGWPPTVVGSHANPSVLATLANRKPLDLRCAKRNATPRSPKHRVAKGLQRAKGIGLICKKPGINGG